MNSEISNEINRQIINIRCGNCQFDIEIQKSSNSKFGLNISNNSIENLTEDDPIDLIKNYLRKLIDHEGFCELRMHSLSEEIISNAKLNCIVEEIKNEFH